MTIKTRINRLVKQASEISYGGENWREQDKALWDGITALDKEVVELGGKGLLPGRHVKWGVADGYAHYFVVKVGKTLTELVHIPYGDGYEFAGTFEDRGRCMVPTAVVKNAIGWSDGMKELWAKHKSPEAEY